MHKEILEQPAAAERVLRGRLDERFATAHLGGLNLDAREPAAIRRVKILGCGSAYYVGQMGAADDRGAGPDPRRRRAGVRVPLPQPGHRARHALRRGQPVRRDRSTPCSPSRRSSARAAGSSAWSTSSARDRPRVRRRDLPARRPGGRGRLDQGADQHGRRLRAARAAPRPGPRPVHRRRPAADRGAAARCPAQIEEILRARGARSPRSPPQLAEAESLFFIGRVRGYPVAREGAQKFKEISYRHAEAYQTSELKHGPLALIDAGAADRRDRARRRADRPQRRRAARDRRPAGPARRRHPPGRRPRRTVAAVRDRRAPERAASSTRSC